MTAGIRGWSVDRRIDEIALPRGVTIGAIVRNEVREDRVIRREVIVPHHDAVIAQNDHVLVFCTHKKLVRQIEKLFQATPGFL